MFIQFVPHKLAPLKFDVCCQLPTPGFSSQITSEKFMLEGAPGLLPKFPAAQNAPPVLPLPPVPPPPLVEQAQLLPPPEAVQFKGIIPVKSAIAAFAIIEAEPLMAS